MFVRPKTFRDSELYLILDEASKLFFDAHGELDFKSIGVKHDISNTVWALVMLSFRLWRLCVSILACTDYYSAAIMYRALIEHFLKHQYIFICGMKEGDRIGEEYVSSEHMAHELLQKLRKSYWPDKLKSIAQDSKTRDSGQFLERAKKAARKFHYDKISRSILRLLPDEANTIQVGLRRIMVHYSILSSYVHAGPSAVLDIEGKTVPKSDVDVAAVLFTVVTFRDTIGLLSSYPSKCRGELKTLFEEIGKKVEKAAVIYEKSCATNEV